MKDITTGASSDIERASAIARNMAMRYGMDDSLGPVAYGESQGSAALGVDIGMSRNYSEDVAKRIDTFVQSTLDAQYKRAYAMLVKHEKKLHDITKVLLKKETLSVEEFIDIFEDKPVGTTKRKKAEAKEKALAEPEEA